MDQEEAWSVPLCSKNLPVYAYAMSYETDDSSRASTTPHSKVKAPVTTKSLWGPFFVGARITTCSSSYFGAHRSFTGPSMSTKDPAPMKRPLLEISFLMVNWTVPFEMYLVTSTPAGTLSVQVKLFRSAQKLPHTSGQSSTPSFVISSSGTSKIR